jgi:hypothetical protein
MTSYGKDPVTGKPLFRDSDAPDIKQDPQEAADYAAEVGNYVVGTTAYLDGYEYKREGLEGFDTTLKVKKRVNASGGWRRAEPVRGVYVGATSATGTVTINHGLGVTPDYAYPIDRAQGYLESGAPVSAWRTRKILETARSSTQVQFLVVNNGDAVVNSPVEFYFEVGLF